MKYTTLFFVLALIVATVQAVALETNAERMARGLPPRAPSKLYRKEPSAVERACLSTLSSFDHLPRVSNARRDAVACGSHHNCQHAPSITSCLFLYCVLCCSAMPACPC